MGVFIAGFACWRVTSFACPKEVTKKKTPLFRRPSGSLRCSINNGRCATRPSRLSPLRDSDNARSYPLLLCASRRLQRGGRVPTDSSVAPFAPVRRVPLEQLSTAAVGGRSKRVSEPVRASFRLRRRLRSAQGIGWSAAQTDCGTGCPFSWLLLLGMQKEVTRPAGRNLQSEFSKTTNRAQNHEQPTHKNRR